MPPTPASPAVPAVAPVSTLRAACTGMAVAAMAAYLLPVLWEIDTGKFRLHPLDWLALVILSPSHLFTGLFDLFYGLMITSWFFLPVGALCGILLSRRVAAHGRARAAAEAVALGFGVGVIGAVVLMLILAILGIARSELYKAAIQIWKLVLLLGLYSSCWLVGLAFWLSRERGSRPLSTLPRLG